MLFHSPSGSPRAKPRRLPSHASLVSCIVKVGFPAWLVKMDEKKES